MQKWKSVWPCPVYVATFADGTVQRMSFASRQGKPLDLDRGRRLVAWACGENVGPGQWLSSRHDMIAGYAEHDGKRIEDPWFAPHNVGPLPKCESPAVAKALDRVAKAFEITPEEFRQFLQAAA